MKIVQRIKEQLENLKQRGSFRALSLNSGLKDFCSNDYLGLARSSELKERVEIFYANVATSGSGGSRLLSGNHPLMEELETILCSFHQADAALLFNSGYDANLSIFSSIPKRGDLVIYDSLVHASIHDGMRMGKAELLAFSHNNLQELKKILEDNHNRSGQIFVAVESLYSMDGDLAPLLEISELCTLFGAALIVDEAHATGVIGNKGVGLVQQLALQDKIFARLHTFGKAIGGHGAVVLGSENLKQYLINYARPLIYSTALSLHDIVHTIHAYQLLMEKGELLRQELHQKISFFSNEIKNISDRYQILNSNSPIQAIFVPGNEAIVALAKKLQQNGFDLRPIRYPTVASGTERLRICLHRFNSESEIVDLINFLKR
jgi:8-amino-7-oxononanoate synthase